MKCEYCGAEKEEMIFVIGACPSDAPDWCMVEGTGKIACPSCYEHIGAREGQEAIDRHVKSFSRQ